MEPDYTDDPLKRKKAQSAATKTIQISEPPPLTNQIRDEQDIKRARSNDRTDQPSPRHNN